MGRQQVTLINRSVTCVFIAIAMLVSNVSVMAEDSSTECASDPATVEQSPAGFSPEKLRSLMRPTFQFGGRWYGESDGVSLMSLDSKVKFPTYPFFGPPPPMISLGFGTTQIDAPDALALPNDLYEWSLGASWMRRWNDRWMFLTMAGAAQATDGENTSSDSWQFRGGAFAMYQPNDRFTWTFGAIALGRNDLPVVPAIGLVYQPNDALRFDLTFPRPKASYLLRDNGARQRWAYTGLSLNGGTWGYQRLDRSNDQLTYRDWQLVLGWESVPKPEQGMPFARGRKIGIELGYAFARRFEFESGLDQVELGDAITLNVTLGF